MKQSLALLLALMMYSSLFAQSQTQVQDKENLFTSQEVQRIDSLLQAYRKKSGNLVVVYTVMADISAEGFATSVQMQYGSPATDSFYSFILLMSRKNSLLFASVNKYTLPYVNEDLLLSLLESGFESLKQKRTAEGVTQICMKAIEFLEQLPKKQ
ncbi:MAG: TPM domain-containing protein [Chitinophagaceae bacterium]|nr:TPM domain-containing protein [Chitinophagaceae bacterium]